ncbi:flagellar motor stator protein MotA [Photobacterium rosenbergii]|uniref:Flagellar motor stator protein MotA n=1 Tax=Photobacterium rosenbergii TaxID=294936 RepID=A0A2T3MXS6_9GAMM|nr:flagellar motor stator protein MotA [Photobacterium rosenbergii]PSW04771.1 flagellar motor stator protein MotA [Photobacterium rosenbergii]
MQKIIGVLIIVLCVFGGFVLAGGYLGTMWQPAELMIILGAGAGALAIGNPHHVIVDMWHQARGVVAKRDERKLYRELLSLMYHLLEQVRQNGMRVLDEHIEEPHQSSLFLSYPEVLEYPKLVTFITDNFRLMAMGKISAHELEGMLELELEAIEEEMMEPSHSMHRIAEAMPGFGILAAVMGIVITMTNIDGDMAQIGISVAHALVGTFLGIFFCYCVFDPLSSAMGNQVKRELSAFECVKAMMVSYTAGKPAIVAADSGRKLIMLDVKPTFAEMEGWVTQQVFQ